MKYRIETALIEIVSRKIVSIVIQGKAQVVEFSSKITTKNTLIDLGCLIVCYFGDGLAILNENHVPEILAIGFECLKAHIPSGTPRYIIRGIIKRRSAVPQIEQIGPVFFNIPCRMEIPP